MTDKITCPSCGHSFDVEEALSGTITKVSGCILITRNLLNCLQNSSPKGINWNQTESNLS